MYQKLVRAMRIVFAATLATAAGALMLPAWVPWLVPIVSGGVWAALFGLACLHVVRTRRRHLRCPSCGWTPFAIAVWKCLKCGGVWDSWATAGLCPFCGHQHSQTACLRCRRISPNQQWKAASEAV